MQNVPRANDRVAGHPCHGPAELHVEIDAAGEGPEATISLPTGFFTRPTR